jgi:hypothetical protein
LGGKAFEHQPVLGFVVAFGGAVVISGIIELVRRLIAWRRQRTASPAEPKADQQEGSQRR